MKIFVALLRGINVGGTGLLPMKELVSLCASIGFRSVRTYIQSGNVLLRSELGEDAVRARLEEALAAKMGKRTDVMVRTLAELQAVVQENPFPDREPAKVTVAFLVSPPPRDLAERVIAPGGELVKSGRREVYVYYPDGMGRSKLKLPLDGAAATVRNMNTVAKLVELAGALE
jgi:uncharacterized protein (DUF1697 family)